MPRGIVAKGIRFSLRHARCAHICRYCLISESRKRSALPFARFEQVVHRFYDWKQANGRDDFEVGIFVGPSFDYNLDIIEGIARLRARRGAAFRILNLGGLRIRSGDALTAWLEERQEAGIIGFHTSLAGCGDIHDRWNGRAGDFDYQTAILRLAGERGMVRQEKLFLTLNTLPLFDRLLDILEAIPGEVTHRSASRSFTRGWRDVTKRSASPRKSATRCPSASISCAPGNSTPGCRNANGSRSCWKPPTGRAA